MVDVYSFDLERFISAQDRTFDTAVRELRAGQKQSHWMWFIFPQLRRLGRSAMADLYGIESLAEAQAYLAHPYSKRDWFSALKRYSSSRAALCIRSLDRQMI